MDVLLSEYCNSTFWDANVSWNTDSPTFSSCFQNTVLVWAPCVFLYIFSGLDILFSIKSKAKNIPWNWRNISKLVIVGFLIVICFFDLFYNVYINNKTALVDVCTPLIKSITLVLCGGLIYSHKKYGRQSSSIIFLFWLLVVGFGAVQFYSGLKGTVETNGITYKIYYGLSCAILLLNFLSDLPPDYSEYPKTENEIPMDSVSFPSCLIFHWFDHLIYVGHKRPLEMSDLWTLKFTQRAAHIFANFNKNWHQIAPHVRASTDGTFNYSYEANEIEMRCPGKGTSVLPALCKTFGLTFTAGALLKLGRDILTFVSPQLLNYLINFTETDEPMWHGYTYAGLLFLVEMLKSLIICQYYFINTVVGLEVRSALLSAIYRKSLRLSSSAKKEYSIGDIVNLMSVDVQRFLMMIMHLNLLWSAPLQIVTSTYFLWQILGPSVLTSVLVLVLMVLLNFCLASRMHHFQMKLMTKKDERVKMMYEILSGIKVLKLYAWEPSFTEIVRKIREREIKLLKSTSYLEATAAFLWSCVPFMVTLLSFATYVLIDPKNVLDAKKAFVSLALFNMLAVPLTIFPEAISDFIQIMVSLKRINKFMNCEEIDPNNLSHHDEEVDQLLMDGGTFSWGLHQKPTLSNINFSVRQGSIVAVVGAVGAGKSSLISAFLGEMNKIHGSVNIKGSIAYVPQQAWIQNATVRDNILLGKPFDSIKYSQIIDACALKYDLDTFPVGEQTEIGEKGINLSGGQKQRISLARAVYSDCDVYFLDDPLSAVDSHVGKHIYDNIISSNGLLGRKTRIIATHNISFLRDVDKIVVLQEGTISEIGTYCELLEKKGAFSEFLTTYSQEVGDGNLEEWDENLKGQISKCNSALQHQLSRKISTSSTTSSNISSYKRRMSFTSQKSKDVQIGQRLIEAEKAETGEVKCQVFKHYLSSIGLWLSITAIVLGLASEGFAVSSNIWLSKWTGNTKNLSVNMTQDTERRDMYLQVFGLLGFGNAALIFAYSLCWCLGCLTAATKIHNQLLSGVIHAPMSFFDTTKLGQILNRFSSDVEVVDHAIPTAFREWFSLLLSVVGIFFVISYSNPFFMSLIIPIGVIYYFIQRFYIATSRQLRRLESISRSPIYSHTAESIAGSSSIRAYNVQERFIKEFGDKVDNNQVCSFLGDVSNRWLQVRLESIGNCIIFSAAIFSVIGRDYMSPENVGLSISYALTITVALNWLAREFSSIETNVVAVERIKEYVEIPQEAPWDVTPNPVRRTWPEIGKVEFVNFKTRYRDELELVLNGVHFTVNGGEKVGIVGRTGAGKSSLTLSLFRIIEAAEGRILIDGIDISRLGLHFLRSRLTIIPQDPVIFYGTLRLNLDPFEEHSDDELWRVLELAHLKSFVLGLTARLQHGVSEGGNNLSVGQRQLICLARALLRNTRVLVLDEATAAVDLETDELIQKTIKSEFKTCTVLTIAHRLNTILDSDKVLVLDKGAVVEFDSPFRLLKNSSSVFYGMACNEGLV